MPRTAAGNAGSRKVEPRKRKRSPSDERRKARRAIAQAVQASARIQGKATRRQRARVEGEANAAASLDTDLVLLYRELNGHRREAFSTGLVPNGAPFKGRTWRAS